MAVNKAIILGNVGQDPEVKSLSNGDAVCNVSIATTERWTDKASDEKREATEWHRVTFFRKLAEIAGQYIKKGSQIYVEGQIKTRKWQDKDGQDRYTTEIVASELKLLGRPAGTTGQQPAETAPARSRQASTTPARQPVNEFDDDIPF